MGPRTPRRWRVAVIIVAALALLATACGGSDPATSRAATPGSDLSADDLIAALAASGIATLDDAGEPLVEVAPPASPVRARELQVRAMAAEAAADNGFGGDDLDHLGGGTATPVPVSALLGAYVLGADTPGADLARRVMHADDAKRPSTAVFPSVVLLLFASDAARALSADAAPAGADTTAAAAGPADEVLAFQPIASTPCSDISGFIYSTIDKVFAAIHIPPGRVGKTGSSFLDSILQGLTDVVVGGLNFVINAAKELLVDGVKYALAQVLDVVAKVATIVALVSNMAMAVSPWNLALAPDDDATTKGISPDVVKDPVTATVRLDGPDEWPTWFADCAGSAGVVLPPLKPIGARVTWTVLQAPAGAELVTDASTTPALYDTALHEPAGGGPGATEATLGLVIGSESPKRAKGDAHPGLVRVDVQIRRTQIEGLRTTLQETANNLASSVLQSIPPVFRSYLLSIVGVGSKEATEDLASRIDGKATTWITVTYHGEPTKPTTTATTPVAAPADGAFCDILERAILAQMQLLQAFADAPLEGADLDATLGQIQAINRELDDAAPSELRSAVSTFVAAGEAMVTAVHAREPDPARAMRTDAAQAASRVLYDYGTTVCRIPVGTG